MSPTLSRTRNLTFLQLNLVMILEMILERGEILGLESGVPLVFEILVLRMDSVSESCQ